MTVRCIWTLTFTIFTCKWSFLVLLIDNQNPVLTFIFVNSSLVVNDSSIHLLWWLKSFLDFFTKFLPLHVQMFNISILWYYMLEIPLILLVLTKLFWGGEFEKGGQIYWLCEIKFDKSMDFLSELFWSWWVWERRADQPPGIFWNWIFK